MTELARTFTVALPDWAGPVLDAAAGKNFTTAEARMGFALDLAERNVAEGTGGPFGAAVFALDDGAILGAAVNSVVPQGQSLAHAEVLALALAQASIGDHDLSAGSRRAVLTATAEPCAMCLGALNWAGVVQLECGARGEDVEAIGFDEGPRPGDWVTALTARGLTVRRDILGERARALLADYVASPHPIYNPGRSRKQEMS